MRGFIKEVSVDTEYRAARGPSVLDLRVTIGGPGWTLEVAHVTPAEWIVPGFEVNVVEDLNSSLRLERVTA